MYRAKRCLKAPRGAAMKRRRIEDSKGLDDEAPRITLENAGTNVSQVGEAIPNAPHDAETAVGVQYGPICCPHCDYFHPTLPNKGTACRYYQHYLHILKEEETRPQREEQLRLAREKRAREWRQFMADCFC